MNLKKPSLRRFSLKHAQSAALIISLIANVALVLILLVPEQKKWDHSYMDAFPSGVSKIGVTVTSKPQEDLVNLDLKQSGSSKTSLKLDNEVGNKVAANTPTPDGLAKSNQRMFTLNQNTYERLRAGYENIFEDLSAQEIRTVYSYMAAQQEFNIRPHLVHDGSHVFGIELHVPNKTAALGYLDKKGVRPPREARVTVVRPDLAVPVVEEYIVGRLPNPSYHYKNGRTGRGTVPYSFFPIYGVKEAFEGLFKTRPIEMDSILVDSYGATFFNCGDTCLMLLPQKTSSAYSDTTVIVLTAYYKTDFPTINPVDLMFVMKETAKGSLHFTLDSIYYAGQTHKSMEDFILGYRRNTINKIKMTFPKPVPHESSNPGTMDSRGKKFPTYPQAGVKQVEPEGKRYSITGQHIQYLEWSFNVRQSTSSGPQLWDVRWATHRIVYELSLQDVAVIYAAANPTIFFAHLSDSAFGLGDKARDLMPGSDCPEHATFLPQTVFTAGEDSPQTLLNAFCVFEHDTGVPLRRHKSEDTGGGESNYGGLVDRVLIVRTIIVEYNYDYIFDFVFHQNGAMEVKTYATGYIMSQVYNAPEAPFGFRVHQNVVGSIHHHLVNFKIDLDIQGVSNRYETLDFVVDEHKWPWYRSGQETFQQISFQHNLKATEKDAVLHYNFSAPKYHIVYNNKEKNKFGNHKAYRFHVNGFSKQILPEDSLPMKSRAWANYQMLATKRKDEEDASSSIFSMFDGADPQVDVTRYIDDNESIVDEDLVFWTTVGFHHIPHTEDIPNTPTVGASASIALLPYNYFSECPSISSRDAIRVKNGGS